MAFITFNGTELPCPSKCDFEGQQTVDSARNANAEVIAQKINRRMVKMSLTWNVLKPSEILTILNCVEIFSGLVNYYDPKTGNRINRQMYWGDYKVSTYWSDKESGNPKMFTGLTASLIDMGLSDS